MIRVSRTSDMWLKRWRHCPNWRRKFSPNTALAFKAQRARHPHGGPPNRVRGRQILAATNCRSPWTSPRLVDVAALAVDEHGLVERLRRGERVDHLLPQLKGRVGRDVLDFELGAGLHDDLRAGPQARGAS
eukprot:6840313-Prymnesium_polylepis.1